MSLAEQARKNPVSGCHRQLQSRQGNVGARWREDACARRATFDQARIDFEAARRLFSSRRIEARLSGVARSARLDRAKVLTAAT
jgi:hypothetical protein